MPKKLFYKPLVLFLLVVSFFSIQFFKTYSQGKKVKVSSPTTGVSTFASQTELDINLNHYIDVVIAYCKEPIEPITQMVQKLKALHSFQSWSLRVLVYYKCQLPLSRKEFLEKTNADRLIELPNKGRESGTFLNYIISQYHHLPLFTLFLQAQPHDIHLVVHLLEHQFTPKVGVLFLNPIIECKCGYLCKENGVFGHVRDIYTLFSGKLCTHSYAVSFLYYPFF
jgi:hypothetical protein